jgi:hypothetical protein
MAGVRGRTADDLGRMADVRGHMGQSSNEIESFESIYT